MTDRNIKRQTNRMNKDKKAEQTNTNKNKSIERQQNRQTDRQTE